MNEELDSQLSAMFDDELPTAECELLARRLSRDEQLKARWGRYAVMGAVIRAERGVRLNAPLAGRVSAVLVAEPSLEAHGTARVARRGGLRWWQPVAATGLAAGVAAVSILWLRAQVPLPGKPPAALAAATPVLPGTAVVRASIGSGARPGESYVVPRPRAMAPVVVPSTELANYVVAHSMFSTPVARRNLLSAFMASEPAGAGAEEALEDVKRAAQ
ncbi:MAG TPA: sigma-E factor negative regulatory protein [Steroidobacteraceae bacterium]|nr:sigma-E factor negative regulatory protein [Steroidobacteraceae bacterium]